MCVDDDAATLALRKALLEASGYSVFLAGSGALALSMLAAGTEVDLVILDYVMPGMNGDELAETLRRRHPALPLVAVSAIGQLPAKLLNAVNCHMQKGQDPEVFLSVIDAVLSRSASTPETQPAPQTVLCVDDEQLQLQLRRLLLESAGFAVLQARDAKTAMDIFRSQPVDAVVMDYWLCGTNGTALAEEMKRLRPQTPIVMLSGFSSLPGEGLIVDAWLRKAEVRPEDLINEVRRLIHHRAPAQPSVE